MEEEKASEVVEDIERKGVADNEKDEKRNENEQKESDIKKGSTFNNSSVEDFEKKKKEDNQESESYHNCIFIDGTDLQNLLINSGNINGNINQSIYKEKGSEENQFLFKGTEDLSEFIKNYFHTNYVSLLITVVVLKAVPENYLFLISDELKKILSSGNEDEEKQASNGAIFQSIEDVIKVLNLERINATIRSETGELETTCLMLRDRGDIQKINTELWKNYPALRGGLIDWLLKVSDLGSVRKTSLYQIVDAIAGFAALDFSYAKNEIIPRFTSGRRKGNFRFLIKILEKCFEVPQYQKNADALLCHWCKLDNKFLWQIAFYIYDEEKEFDFNLILYDKLRNIIEQELYQGIEHEETDIVFDYDFYSMISFKLLQERIGMSQIYIKLLATVFRECKTRNEKIRFGYYFCNLFVEDYLAEGYPNYESFFIRSMNYKELKKQMRPLLQYIWRKKVFGGNSICNRT